MYCDGLQGTTIDVARDEAIGKYNPLGDVYVSIEFGILPLLEPM